MIDPRTPPVTAASRTFASTPYPNSPAQFGASSQDATALDVTRSWIRQNPGKGLLVGLAVGGVVGWLTSKLK